MTEDEIYRASTQYRLWSYTPESLASLRAVTNASAADHVRIAIRRSRAARSQTASADGSAATSEAEGNGIKNVQDGSSDAPSEQDIDCLTIEEERKLVEFYCSRVISVSAPFDFPINVVGSAIQFMKRFYLTNSPMTYHPKQIMLAALFLSTKTENHHIYLKDYVDGLINKAKQKKISQESILAPEFILTQGLRFTFDVRHPHRGLKGGYLELIALANGKAALLPGANKSAHELQQEMQGLLPNPGGHATQRSTSALHTRINQAYGLAKDTLRGAALLTDAYFLYTPSQIWLASLLLADEPLTLFYLSTKFPDSGPTKSTTPFESKVLSTLRACAAHLATGGTAANTPREELVRIDKKLYHCQNPEKVDLVGLNRAQKRDGRLEGRLDESVVKRRKLEREKSFREGEELFGGELVRKEGETA